MTLPTSTPSGPYPNFSQVSYPSRERWAAVGGVYAPEFLDAVTQMTLILVTDSTVYYAGGFESAHFLRQPTVRV